jgi:hypothetical protein
MFKNDKGNYTSDACKGCYSARLLNVYPATARKLESAGYPDMDDFKADITKISVTEFKGIGRLRYIRFYSLADFMSEKDVKYIRAAADIMPVEIFSKTLHEHFRELLPQVAAHPNVNISLSLNKNWSEEYIEELYNFLVEHRLTKNVQLNYCFIGDEKVRPIPYISVYHTTKRDKIPLFEVFGHNRVCCARGDDGTKITEKNSGNYKGSCIKCPLCKLPAANADGELLTPKKREELYAIQAQVQ